MYSDGKVLPQDYAEALRWLHKAAEQEDSIAQYKLGSMYAQGMGVLQKYTAAVRWFRKAADQGSSFGEIGLGLMYEEGNGVSQDFGEAGRWFSKAALRDDPVAQFHLGRMCARANDHREAVRWYRRAADQGHTDAQVQLGVLYAFGRGVLQDSRRLQPFRYLHDCSGCFRLERWPGGPCTHWKAPPYHGAHPKRAFALAQQVGSNAGQTRHLRKISNVRFDPDCCLWG